MTPFMMAFLLKIASVGSAGSGSVGVAILAVPAAVALPAYQDYIVKTQITRIVGELAYLKTPIDEALFDGKKPVLSINCDENTEECLGILDESGDVRSNLLSKVEFVGDIQNGNEGGVQATAGKKVHKSVAGVKIRHHRSAETGVWRCLIDPSNAKYWKNKYAPIGCEIKSLEN